jgi:hypothetical protein
MPTAIPRATIRHLLDLEPGLWDVEAGKVSRSHPMRAVLVGVAALTLLAGCSSASKPVISPKVAVAGATGKAIIIGGIAALSGGEEE